MDTATFWTITATTSLSAAAVIYHHAVYPLILARAAKKSEDTRMPWPSLEFSAAPRIDIIMPAYNEAEQIAWKVRNLARLEYPKGRVRIIVACDGCTDGTAVEAQQAADEFQGSPTIEVISFSENRGKIAVLNEMIGASRADVVALTDVSAELPSDTLTLGAAHFQDNHVGVVAGTYRMAQPGSAGEEAYWSYQTRIKQGEAALGAPLGVHGAFYMFRREVFHPLPADTINDDFILPMEIVANGFRAIYDSRIVALETETASSQTDLNRRKRIAAGNAQQLVRLLRLLHPKHKGIAFAFLSGKALRVVMPFLLLTALLGSAVLALESDFFAFSAALQMLGYAVAASHSFFPKDRAPKPVAILKYIMTGHAASLVGVVRYAIGLDRVPWRRAATS